nr:MAG TPA: hypothetical protein [Caudoviricetes sp.]
MHTGACLSAVLKASPKVLPSLADFGSPQALRTFADSSGSTISESFPAS